MKFNRYLLFFPFNNEVNPQETHGDFKKETLTARSFKALVMGAILSPSLNYGVFLMVYSFLAFIFNSKEFCIFKLNDKYGALSFSKADTKFAVNVEKICYMMNIQKIGSWVPYFNFSLLLPVLLSLVLNHYVLFTSFGNMRLYQVHLLEMKESVICNELAELKSKLEKRNKAHR